VGQGPTSGPGPTDGLGEVFNQELKQEITKRNKGVLEKTF
jgi:hypothetical protein